MNAAPSQKTDKPSKKAKVLAARLMAVQALFQAQQNEQTIKAVRDEYLEHRAGMTFEGETMIMPDGALFKKILDGVAERKNDLAQIVTHHFSPEKQEKEQLMTSLLTCCAYELLAHDEVDTPILINDYLNVGHGFFSESETGYMNALLDSIAKAVRA